jgi:hypothetical protein
VSGVFGVDLQHSRTIVALAEAAGGRVRTDPVGDGRRALIPNAADDTGWASDAGSLTAKASPLHHWHTDPGGAMFLRGLRDRLIAYLGGGDPTLAGGYPLCVAGGGSATGGDGAALRREAAVAGLPDLLTATPGDALLCRWLTDPAGDADPGFRGPVTVVACGERETTIRAYEVVRTEDRLSVRRGPGRRVDAGSGAWTDRLCAEVLDRCRGVLPGSTLHLLDAALEYGARMRHTPVGRILPWRGVLGDHLTTPLRLTRADMAGWDEVSRAVGTIAAAVGGARSSGPRPTVVVGGLGAVWPFPADALNRSGAVWSSTEPEFDVAVGAAWWPALSSCFIDGPAGSAQPVAAVASSRRAGELPWGSTSASGDGPVSADAPTPPWQSAPALPAADDETPPWRRS